MIDHTTGFQDSEAEGCETDPCPPRDGLFNPAGIAVDASANVYVASFGTSSAFKITPSGVITQIINFLGDGVNKLHNAIDVAVDA
ncbi:MAG: hypothetical protein IH921_12065, partial [Gemmatimonadetes bacterium]|nr:hypothetical protein [Gemmatimonadota bacterium]